MLWEWFNCVFKTVKAYGVNDETDKWFSGSSNAIGSSIKQKSTSLMLNDSEVRVLKKMIDERINCMDYVYGFERDLQGVLKQPGQLSQVIASLVEKNILYIDDNEDTSYAPSPHPGPMYVWYHNDEEIPQIVEQVERLNKMDNATVCFPKDELEEVLFTLRVRIDWIRSLPEHQRSEDAYKKELNMLILSCGRIRLALQSTVENDD